jgi:hypothetical protein
VQLLSPLTGNDRKTLTRNAEQAIRAALAHAQEEAA